MTERDVKSARRTLEVLEHFAATHRPATVGEIARTLGFPQSSTSMLLSELTRLGYLEQNAARQFRPTLRVLLLGGWMQDRLLGEGSLLRRLEGLRTRHQATVLVGMQAGARVRYILTLRRPQADPTMRAGMMRHIGRAAVGKALLMGCTDGEAMRLLRRANAEQPVVRVDVVALMEDLRRSRDLGWTESRGAVVRGQNVIAMPLPPIPDHPPLAVGLGMRVEDSDRRRESLLQALERLRTALAREVRSPSIG